MNISLDQIEAFVATATTGSFSAAGKSLGKSQSTISIAVSNLELDLGVELFNRDKRLPVLTEFGRELLRDANSILEGSKRLYNKGISSASGLESELRIGIDSLISTELLKELTEVLEQRYPTLPIKIYQGPLRDVETLLDSEAIHLGIAPHINNHLSIKSISLFDIGMQAVASRNHPLVKLKKVSESDLINHTQIVVFDRVHQNTGTSHTVLSPKTLKVDNLPLKVSLLEEGVGWGRIPDHALTDKLKKLNFAFGKNLQVRMGVLFKQNIALQPASTFCLNYLNNKFQSKKI